MNTVTEEKKDAITKTLAIVGFVAAIILAVWLSVTIVRFIPSAFTSLASIAESVYNYRPNEQLTIATNNDVINSGQSYTISWTMMHLPGTYAFSYTCTDGVTVDARIAQGAIEPVTCGAALELGSNVSLDLTINSSKDRFVDVPYAITFTPENQNSKPVTTTNKVTIVNPSIPTMVAQTGGASPSPAQTTVVPTNNTASTSASNHSATTTTPTTKTVQRVIYALPVSDPNGKVDLAVKFIAVGILNGQQFMPTAGLHTGQPGAFQFAVTNTGTRTADSWAYVAQLPGGLTYNGGQQVALKPNETAYITIGFPGLSNAGSLPFGASVATPLDVNTSNNNFSWNVSVN